MECALNDLLALVPPPTLDEDEDDYGDQGWRTDPLYKVSSITISTTLLPCDVYGTITIFCGITKKQCVIYHRGCEDPESITSETSSLTLTSSDGDVLYMHLPQLIVDLKAKGKVTDVCISKGTMAFAEITGDEMEQKLSLTIPGDQGYACCVHYFTFPFAVTADLEFILIANGDRDSNRDSSKHDKMTKIKVYGKITAYLVPDYGWSGVPQCSGTRTEFLNRPETHFRTVFVGSPIKLDKSLLAVPAYSSLRIEVCLIKCGSNEVLFEDEIVFTMHDTRKTLHGKDYDLGVEVHWVVPFDRHTYEGDTARLKIGDLLILPKSEWPTLIIGSQLVEVFSVCIFRENDEPLMLFGNINYMDEATNTIYDRTMDKPQLLTQGDKYLSLTSPSETLVWNEHFGLFLNLKDVTGRFAISGYVPGVAMLSDRLAHWFDRPNCSIIKGNHAFAAVHYTILSSAVKACVRVFYCEGGSDVDVGVLNGMVTASYGDHYPLESYSKKCCHIVLFDGSFDPQKGPEIKLSRCIVASPLNRSLRIGFNLYADSNRGEPLHKTLLFQPNINGSSQVMMGKQFGVQIVVEWSKPDEENY